MKTPIRLTERERTVLEMLAAGDSLQDIARSLDEDRQHVMDQIDSATRKLGAEQELDVIAIAIREGHIL